MIYMSSINNSENLTTLSSVTQQYINLNVFNKRTASTVAIAARLFEERSGIASLPDLDMTAIARFKEATLLKAKPITYNGYLKYLRLIGDFAVEHGYLHTNWFRKAQLSPVGRIPTKDIPLGKLKTLEMTLYEKQESLQPWWFWQCVMDVLFYTGMRRRQLVHLRLSDFDFRRRTINLRYASSKTLREWEIPLVDELESSIRYYVYNYQQHTGWSLQNDDYLFQIHRANPRYAKNYGDGGMKPEQVTGFFKRLSQITGIRAGAHRYRHTLATRICNPGDGSPPDVFSAQEILGHANINTTRGYVGRDLTRMGNAMKKVPKTWKTAQPNKFAQRLTK